MNPPKEHPCGAVPVSQWSVHVWYCHSHQAYFASSAGFTETGSDGTFTRAKHQNVEFGPFDTATDVQHWVQTQLPGIRQLARPVDAPETPKL